MVRFLDGFIFEFLFRNVIFFDHIIIHEVSSFIECSEVEESFRSYIYIFCRQEILLDVISFIGFVVFLAENSSSVHIVENIFGALDSKFHIFFTLHFTSRFIRRVGDRTLWQTRYKGCLWNTKLIGVNPKNPFRSLLSTCDILTFIVTTKWSDVEIGS